MLDVCRASLGHRVTTVSVQQRVTEFISAETNVISVRREF